MIVPLILIGLIAPVTAWFGFRYFRAANTPHEREK